MQNLLSSVYQFVNLSKEEISELAKIISTQNYQRGEVILKQDSVNKKLLFINSGLLKISFFKEDKEFIMKFFSSNEFCAVLDSLTTNQSSNYSIVAIASSDITSIDFQALKVLSSRYPNFEKLILGISSMATRKMMSRIRELLETDASQRYQNFLNENGHVVNEISLRDLSGYLGISQVSLSRIRART